MKTEQLKSKFDLFDYLMYGYSYILEEVETKKGKQKRLKDDELEKSLKEKTKELIKVKDLFVELKLGPSYNRVESPWIQVFSEENRSGTRGRYVGISFVKETNTIELWLGFGKTAKKKREIQELAKGYRIKYSLIEPSLKYGFEYDNNAIVIKKKFKMADFKEDEFDRDLTDEQRNSFFDVNAPAILLPFVRAYISSLTSLSGFNHIILPTINFAARAENEQ